jgi:hypothetical protein
MMMMTDFKPLVVQGTKKSFSGRWRLIGEKLELEIDGKSFAIESEGDLATNVRNMERTLGKRFFHQSVSLKACLNCQHFRMSGMAREMGRGQRGVCSLYETGVEICHVCKDYAKTEAKVSE